MPTPALSARRSVAREAATVIGGFVALLWLIEIADRILPAQLDAHGVRPWSSEGLLGIVFAPVLHGTRRPGQILVGVLVLFVYGGALWGVLPGAAGVSWQMHLFGALGGVSASWLLARPTVARGVRRP